MPYAPLVEGRADSPVRVVIYEDLACRDCLWLRRKLDDRLLPAYGDRVAFEHREFPLAKHLWARPAAIAARGLDGALAVEFRREILEDLAGITPESLGEWVRAFERRHGVTTALALDSAEAGAAVDADHAAGIGRGVSKTPTMFLGAQAFVERIPLDELTAAMDAALEEAGQ